MSRPRATGRSATYPRPVRPDPELVEHYRQAIAERPKIERAAYALGYLVSSIRAAAEDE